MTTRKEKGSRDWNFVRRLNNDYVQCRSMRHAWNLLFFGHVRQAPEPIVTSFSPHTIVRQSECVRCGCIKEDFFGSREAAKLSPEHPKFRAFYSRYRHPQGYLWSSKETENERPAVYDFTEELYTRFTKDTLGKE